MKQWTKYLGFAGLLLVPVLFWVGIASAQSFRTGDNTTVAADEVVDSTLYATGRTVDIAGEVNGDVFCAGQNVTVSGTVHGDVICAGQTVNVSGNVMGDVRVAGQTVTLAAQVEDNLSVGAQSFSFTSEGKVGQDAGIAANDITLNGSVGRDLSAGGAMVTLASTVGRNVEADAEELTLSDKAKINGNLNYSSTTEASVASGAQIAGTTTWDKKKVPKEGGGNYGQVLAFGFGFALFVILSLLLVSLVLVLIFPGLFSQTAKHALADPLKTFLTGLIASFAAPVLIIGLMITAIGLPIGFLLGVIWLLVLLLAGPFFGYLIGKLILKKQTNPVLIMLVGSLVILVAYLIPIIGTITLLAVVWFGTGMILREIYRRTPKPTYGNGK